MIHMKATLVWMDPPNTIISGKLLLYDVDIKVISPDGATTYYGNNNADDEVNNVEQVAIPVPVTGVYTVVVTSHTFTESDTQAVSVVITSPGVVSSRSEGTVQSADNQLSLWCGVFYDYPHINGSGRGWMGHW